MANKNRTKIGIKYNNKYNVNINTLWLQHSSPSLVLLVRICFSFNFCHTSLVSLLLCVRFIIMDFNKKGNREFFNDGLLFKSVAFFFLIIAIFFVIADYKIYQKKKELAVEVASGDVEEQCPRRIGDGLREVRLAAAWRAVE